MTLDPGVLLEAIKQNVRFVVSYEHRQKRIPMNMQMVQQLEKSKQRHIELLAYHTKCLDDLEEKLIGRQRAIEQGKAYVAEHESQYVRLKNKVDETVIREIANAERLYERIQNDDCDTAES